MTRNLLFALLIYPIGVGAGQILFKVAASRMRPGVSPFLQLTDPMLIAAVLFYGLLSIAWMLIVRQLPLSTAYPFVALSFVFTPLFALLLFNEKLHTNYLFGIAMICAGVILTQRSPHVL